MHIHILGICGTFMGGVAILARQLGFKVTGSDVGVYPPMSTQLEAQGIGLIEGYESAQLVSDSPDVVVVGNALSRGNSVVELMLDKGLPYISGPEFVKQYVFPERWVLAVAGTHGKTTTSSMLVWILEQAGMQPGFLVGGVPENFGVSARLGASAFFVIEADEYDTAFFDKRSKFVHYQPRTLVLNNLEYDHADIFPDLAAIQRQFHHLVRIVPNNGLIISPDNDENIQSVLEMGCWTPTEIFSMEKTLSGWWSRLHRSDGSAFEVFYKTKSVGKVEWSLMGLHNVQNALAAMAAAKHVGVLPSKAIEALQSFQNVKRRMEVKGVIQGITIYDDFAHHPTAIKTTLAGLRERVGTAKIFAVFEPRSNTMKMGIHQASLMEALSIADSVYLFQPAGMSWDISSVTSAVMAESKVFTGVEDIIRQLLQKAQTGDHILIMSNGGFENIHTRLINTLESYAR